MITLKTVNVQVEQIKSSLEKATKDRDIKEVKKLSKRLEYLNGIKFYLESQPSENFLKSNLNEIKKRIASLSSGFGEWLKSVDKKDSDPKKLKTRFNTEMGLGKMKNQIKTLEFILSK